MPAANAVEIGAAEPVARTADNQDAAGEVLVDEVLVEEVSIDGMCGVY